MAARDQDAVTTAVLLLGGGAAGYALGRLVLGRHPWVREPKLLLQGASLAPITMTTATVPAALVGAIASPGMPASAVGAVASPGIPASAVGAIVSPPAPRPSRPPSANDPVTRPVTPSPHAGRPPSPIVVNPPAPRGPQRPQRPTTTAIPAQRPTAMPVPPNAAITTRPITTRPITTRPITTKPITTRPITTTPSATTPPVAGPPPSAHPIDPYVDPSPSTPPRVLVGPPVSAVPIDPYTRPSQSAVTTRAPTGPITSPSQLDPAASAALGAELATVLTSTGPSSPSRRPVLPSAPKPTGPITSPAQVATTTPTTVRPPIELEIGPVTVMPSSTPVPMPSAQLPRRFDSIFERYRGSIPIELLRALVARESSFNPSAQTGSAIGLMQIIPVVLDDYNKRRGTAYQRAHLVDPSINIAIGCELLRIIITSYRRNHPRVPNLQENWDNPRFAELLVLGWNAGYSEAGGLGRVARYLEARGTLDITIDTIHEQARATGASKHLSNPAKVRWSKSVVALYLRERAASRGKQLAARSAANSY